MNNSWGCPPSEGCAADTLQDDRREHRGRRHLRRGLGRQRGPGLQHGRAIRRRSTPPRSSTGAINSSDDLARGLQQPRPGHDRRLEPHQAGHRRAGRQRPLLDRTRATRPTRRSAAPRWPGRTSSASSPCSGRRVPTWSGTSRRPSSCWRAPPIRTSSSANGTQLRRHRPRSQQPLRLGPRRRSRRVSRWPDPDRDRVGRRHRHVDAGGHQLPGDVLGHGRGRNSGDADGGRERGLDLLRLGRRMRGDERLHGHDERESFGDGDLCPSSDGDLRRPTGQAQGARAGETRHRPGPLLRRPGHQGVLQVGADRAGGLATAGGGGPPRLRGESDARRQQRGQASLT